LHRPAGAPAIPDAENFAAANGPFGYPDTGAEPLPLNFVLDAPRFTKGERMTIEKACSGEADPGRFRRVRNPSNPLGPGYAPNAADFLRYCDEHFNSVWPAILEAEARPKTQVPVPATQFLEKSYLSYLNIRKTAQLHSMRGLAFLDLHRGQEALGEIAGTFRLAKAMHAGGEVNLMHSMMENAVMSVPMPDIWEGLVDRRWSEPELTALQRELAAFHPVQYWPEVVDGERAYYNALFDELASACPSRRSADFRSLFSNGSNSPNRVAGWLGAICPIGVIRDNQLAANQLADGVRAYIDSTGRFNVEKFAAFDYDKLATTRFALAWRITPSWQRACERVVGVEAWLREATTATALERYRLSHHEFPEHLEALVPELLAAVPSDPVDGQPIRYTRDSVESYRLWCLGEYAGVQFSDVCETQKLDGHDVILWPGLGPEKPAPAVASR
jgi:hypothetical protein